MCDNARVGPSFKVYKISNDNMSYFCVCYALFPKNLSITDVL